MRVRLLLAAFVKRRSRGLQATPALLRQVRRASDAFWREYDMPAYFMKSHPTESQFVARTLRCRPGTARRLISVLRRGESCRP